MWLAQHKNIMTWENLRKRCFAGLSKF